MANEFDCMRMLVLVADTCPLEADEIRRLLRHVNKLGELYYVPGATSLKDFTQRRPFVDDRPSKKQRKDFFGTALPCDIYALYQKMNRYGATLLINPSTTLLEEEDQSCQYVFEHFQQLTIIDGFSVYQPAALIQLASSFGVFPDQRMRLVAKFSGDFVSTLTSYATQEESDWLLWRNWQLQGISLAQILTMRKLYHESVWGSRNGRHNIFSVIVTEYKNCTPLYLFWYADGKSAEERTGTVDLVTTPKRHFVFGHYRQLEMLDKALEERYGRNIRLNAKTDFSDWSHAHPFEFPGGLKDFSASRTETGFAEFARSSMENELIAAAKSATPNTVPNTVSNATPNAAPNATLADADVPVSITQSELIQIIEELPYYR